MTGQRQEYRITELERKLANAIRTGVITEADYTGQLVRVRYDDENPNAVTAWVPFLTARAGGDREWWAPEVGEQVMLLSPSGELTNAVALPAIYSTQSPAPSADPDKHLVRYADGAEIEYDRSAHRLKISCDVEIVGNLTVTGNIAATGNVEAGGHVEDGLGTMDEMRGTYNGHTHGSAPGVVTQAANQRMK